MKSKLPSETEDPLSFLNEDISTNISQQDKRDNNDFLGQKSSFILNQELTLTKKNVEKWKSLANKYSKEKSYLVKELKKKRQQVFNELWSIRTLLKIIKITKLPHFISFFLLIDSILLTYILFNIKKQNSYNKYTINKQKLHLNSNYPYTIQIGTFNKLHKAQEVTLHLKKLGYQAYIGKVFHNNTPIYRVYVNEFKKLNEAQQTLKKLKKIPLYKKCFVRRKY